MNKKMQLFATGLCIATLTACSPMYQTSYTRYTAYQPYAYEDTRYYSQSYEGGANYDNSPQRESGVKVPESYHVGSYRSPASHKDLDRAWVNSQNPQAYTIEIADGEKASQVAGKLSNAPKTDRRAAVKYYRDGKTYYKGVYGSYNSYDEAQKALNSLPENIKQGADIKSWNKVQNKVGN